MRPKAQPSGAHSILLLYGDRVDVGRLEEHKLPSDLPDDGFISLAQTCQLSQRFTHVSKLQPSRRVNVSGLLAREVARFELKIHTYDGVKAWGVRRERDQQDVLSPGKAVCETCWQHSCRHPALGTVKRRPWSRQNSLPSRHIIPWAIAEHRMKDRRGEGVWCECWKHRCWGI